MLRFFFFSFCLFYSHYGCWSIGICLLKLSITCFHDMLEQKLGRHLGLIMLMNEAGACVGGPERTGVKTWSQIVKAELRPSGWNSPLLIMRKLISQFGGLLRLLTAVLPLAGPAALSIHYSSASPSKCPKGKEGETQVHFGFL